MNRASVPRAAQFEREIARMPTTFFLRAQNSQRVDLQLDRFQTMLPGSMTLDDRTDGLYLTVESQDAEDQSTQRLVDRELDRVFLLTCVRVRAEMVRRYATSSTRGAWSVHGELPMGKGPQAWTETLALQLRLWRLACDAEDLLAKIIFYFQIIELAFPATGDKGVYPLYRGGSSDPPHPRTESKLLRNLVAHAASPYPETLAYLRYLGLPEVLSNHAYAEWEPKLRSRLCVLEEARGVLRHSV